MASWKLIRSHLRGRRFCTESPAGTSDALLSLLEPHVKTSGQAVLCTLRTYLVEERRGHKQLLEKEKQLLEKEKQLLEWEKESRAKVVIDLLRAWGLNDVRGLFEMIQDHLAGTSNITARLTGADLWEAILRANVGMRTCIQRCTKVPTNNVAKQALHCYNVFSILSQHIHDGKSLAELQAAQGGTIIFDRGPLSSEQVEVLKCLGAAASVKIAENTASRLRFRG